MLTNNLQNDVLEFQKKFYMIDPQYKNRVVKLTEEQKETRITLLKEELQEFITACIEDDIYEQADALVDLVYIALGTSNLMNLPFQELWDDVHRANMQKERGIKPSRNLKVDVIKPEGWVGPKTEEIIKKYE